MYFVDPKKNMDFLNVIGKSDTVQPLFFKTMIVHLFKIYIAFNFGVNIARFSSQ